MARRTGARMINSSRWQKQATVLITKQLEQIADDVEKDATEIIKYKENVLASYSPRSQAGIETQEYNAYQKSREQKLGTRLHKKKQTYHHTGIFIDSIYTEVNNKTVKIKIRDETYPDGASTTQVYEWLTKGTEGSDKTNPDNYSTGWARNYPTPPHLFEEHTREQMKGFLDNFGENIKNDYKKRKYKRRK